MNEVYVLCPDHMSEELKRMVDSALNGSQSLILNGNIDNYDLKNKKLLFAVELDKAGYCHSISKIISDLYNVGCDSLYGSSAAILIHSSSELYTKSSAQSTVFLLNQLGCRFIGHPVVEATAGFLNFLTWQKTMSMSLEEICLEMCSRLGRRLSQDNPSLIPYPKILALHSSSNITSNTLMLWHMVKEHFKNCEVRELHVENGTVLDCKGCSFKTCIHYSKQSSCFYGGFMIDEIFPAIENCDSIVWVCPNYNDSISANLMAVINRLTALYRKISFYNKSIFAIVVSGNSGSDSVAKQLIGALNINKGFRLPPNFALMSTANDPGAIMNVPFIESKAEDFALRIISEIKK